MDPELLGPDKVPRDFRLTASEASTVLRSLIPEVRALSEQEFAGFISWVPSSSVSGGAVYDALVGWVARVTELPLITRDERAVPTYRELGIEVLFVGD